MEREWLREQLEAGRSMEAIAREVGVHASTVRYWVKKFALKSRHADRHANRGRVPRERLAALVAEQLTVREIAELLDVSYTTARYWLQRYGLQTTATARRRAKRGSITGICRVHGATEHRVSSGRLICAKCRSGTVTEWRRRAKRILVEEAGGRCVLCGYERCIAALQFHHVDPKQKRFGLGSRGLAQAIDKLREEASKCVLLCANCHAEVEAGAAQLPLRAPNDSVRGSSPDLG